MYTRQFLPQDLAKLNKVNLDPFTENYDLLFYYEYLTNWPDANFVVVAEDGSILAYIIGKLEGEAENWHGHITAISVASEMRRKGLARQLLDKFEAICWQGQAKFIDLYVRESNTAAVQLYAKRSYVKHQTVPKYYSDGEDAWDMRLYPPSLIA